VGQPEKCIVVEDRTGDRARKRVADDQIDYVGQEEHEGYHIELQAVAAMLRSGQFSEAVQFEI
jgi:hypothetical protein